MPNDKPQDERLEARDAEIWKLYTSKSFSQARIAEHLGMSQTAVSAAIARIRKTLPPVTREAVIERRLALLDEIMADLRGDPGDPQAARAVLAAMEREAKLLGLDAPTKQQVEQRMVRYEITDGNADD